MKTTHSRKPRLHNKLQKMEEAENRDGRKMQRMTKSCQGKFLKSNLLSSAWVA